MELNNYILYLRYRGIEIDVINTLADYSNFTYHFVQPEDKEWGRIDENGSWTGMIGETFNNTNSTAI